RSNPSVVELTAEKFDQYVKEEGLEAAAALRARRGQSGAARDLFSRCAKSLVLSGPPQPRYGDRPLGFTLELVAERNPYAMAAGLACVPLGATIGAHEIGTTRVVASLTRDDTYTIDVTTDAGALLGRLELASKRPRSSPASAAEYQRAFAALCGELPHHVAVVFDDVPDEPRADCTVDAPGGVAGDDL